MDRDRVILADILRPGKSRRSCGTIANRCAGPAGALKQAHIRFVDGPDARWTMTEAWTHKGDWVLKFARV